MSGSPFVRRTRARHALLAVPLALALSACVTPPSAPPYPYWGPYGSKQAVLTKAQDISSKLEQYVKDWLDGKKAARIPDDLLPPGTDTSEISNFYLQRPSEIDPARQWVVRPADPTINPNAAPGLFPEVNATYYVAPYFLAPFGTRVNIEGNFPHARFFSIQATPPFDPSTYKYNSYMGLPEVPFLDKDINPMPGSTNPFRVGADRNASNRAYKVTYDLKIGNGPSLEPAYRPPLYSAPGNTRSAAAMAFQGPWADPGYKPWEINPLAHRRGMFAPGELWVRVYVPDKNTGVHGGVGLPKITYQLPDGREYFINADFSKWAERANRREPLANTGAAAPGNDQTSDVGFYKTFGVFRTGIGNYARYSDPYGLVFSRQYVRDLDKGVTGRGENQASPGNFEPSATLATNMNYLARQMSREQGKVVVISGRKPTTPKTRDGQATMAPAQQRFWSITSYDVEVNLIDQKAPFGQPVWQVMDEDLVTDANGNFVLVVSSPADRPSNATAANGVTWRDWGPTATQAWLIRYMSVGADWTFGKAPTYDHLGWATDWASQSFNRDLIGRNNRNGYLGEYQPVVSYMSKTAFQNLGGNLNPSKIPLGSGW